MPKRLGREKEKPLDLGIIPLQSCLALRASANDLDILLNTTTLQILFLTCVHRTSSHSFTQPMPLSYIHRTKVLGWNGFQHQLLYIVPSTSINPHIPSTWNFALIMTCPFRILLPLWWTPSQGLHWPQLGSALSIRYIFISLTFQQVRVWIPFS